MEVEEEEETQETEADGTQPLQFNEPLTWRPGKAILVTELLRRLKALSEELASVEQEDADRESLVPKAQELASPLLISHKDKGVKAYTMLCIVEMFRLLAPDAPYKGGQLKEIFTLFTSSMVPALENPSDPYNQQHTAILNSLTTVKSIVLLTDIPGSETLILNLFSNCFDVMSASGKAGVGEKLPKNLEYHMTSMLCTLVDECSALPAEVADKVLAQFLRVDPSSLLSSNKKGASQAATLEHETSPAYNMARAICNTCHEKMSRAIGQYFSSVLIDATESFSSLKGSKSRGKKRTHDESEDESDDGLLTPPVEEDLREVEKAHRLLRELWRSAPDVILNVVPQMEAEIEAENPQLRTMAVQTVGDMIAGIGAAGPPSPPILDPAAYPSQSVQEGQISQQSLNPLLVPNAPHAFSSVYSNAYQRFVERFKDKAATVRSAWVTEAGRILATSAGGKGLDQDQEKTLLTHFANLLLDVDERVRLSAVQAITNFDYAGIVQKIGKSGSVSTPGSVLCNLADRIKDRKHHVRIAAMELLGRIWGVAAGAIAEGSERIRDLFGAIPSKIFEAWYINEREINTLVQHVLFDSLLPVTYPPIKSKQPSARGSQRISESQGQNQDALGPDYIRAERILVLVRDLEHKAKTVFFNLQSRQGTLAKYVDSYLTTCEDMIKDSQDDKSTDSKKKLDKLIEYLCKVIDGISDPSAGAEHLRKFAKHRDRRSYQLVRFCYSPQSDYRKIQNALKELQKRLEEAPTGMPVVLETLIPLIRSTAILVYNRSHVPAIVEISRTNEKGLGNAAHEILKEISAKAPEIFKVHVHELCETLKTQVPDAETISDSATVDTLKACAGFARRFPDGMPQDRDFFKAMVAYATRGMPPKAAKHAVTVIISSADKKEMYIRELQKACIKGFKYGEHGYLSKLATISQLRLLANKEVEDQADAIMEIAVSQILLKVRTAADLNDPEWSEEVDEDLEAKIWALRILVNQLRGSSPELDAEDPAKALLGLANPIYKLLNTLVNEDGELSKSSPTPRHHKARLRLAAAIQLLKLSCRHEFDASLEPIDFNRLSKIAQDEMPEVRAGFVAALMKYLGSGALPHRFYALVFLYAFEPKKETMESTATWLKSRAAISAKRNETVMEGVFLRFMSLLAHHPDFSMDVEELKDFVDYIMFYLKNVATVSNISMIYHLAQRLKTLEDGIDSSKSENLYVLSDMAEAVIRQYAELQGWALHAISNKAGLPRGLFGRLPSHAKAQEIAGKRYLPEDLSDKLEDLVKSNMRTKKRKPDSSHLHPAKKPRPSTDGTASAKKPKAAKPVKTPKKRREDSIPSSERRKSSRSAQAKNYAENEDDEDDEEMEQWQDEDEEAGREANKENVGSSTPPTSDPTPAPPSAKKLTPRTKTITPKSARKTVGAAQKGAKKLPTRTTRATRGKKVKDIM
jgi:sister-chromatid-cohesion protein PDS5